MASASRLGRAVSAAKLPALAACAALVELARECRIAAPRQHRGLLDPVLAGDPALVPEQAVDPGGIARRPGGELGIARDALHVQQLLHLGVDAADPLQVVALQSGRSRHSRRRRGCGRCSQPGRRCDRFGLGEGGTRRHLRSGSGGRRCRCRGWRRYLRSGHGCGGRDRRLRDWRRHLRSGSGSSGRCRRRRRLRGGWRRRLRGDRCFCRRRRRRNDRLCLPLVRRRRGVGDQSAILAARIIGVAATGQNLRLLDPILLLDATAETELLRYARDVGRQPARDVAIARDAELLQFCPQGRVDRANPGQVVDRRCSRRCCQRRRDASRAGTAGSCRADSAARLAHWGPVPAPLRRQRPGRSHLPPPLRLRRKVPPPMRPVLATRPVVPAARRQRRAVPTALRPLAEPPPAARISVLPSVPARNGSRRRPRRSARAVRSSRSRSASDQVAGPAARRSGRRLPARRRSRPPWQGRPHHGRQLARRTFGGRCTRAMPPESRRTAASVRSARSRWSSVTTHWCMTIARRFYRSVIARLILGPSAREPAHEQAEQERGDDVPQQVHEEVIHGTPGSLRFCDRRPRRPSPEHAGATSHG